ncbi:M20/M25/M40 family metallo-hydrolase [Pseudonocardia sp. TRM90224]|uniref:M20/M25/M40 family metallo-hydrolase n=1 Tax=Pseudonocardia sp. TRM90224 TaxID=2812678 RepID=UPI001E3CADEA|nr:M20/M25/M40 family metallo-hydrolase [Pseudonocardia sp. TRM90224]
MSPVVAALLAVVLTTACGTPLLPSPVSTGGTQARSENLEGLAADVTLDGAMAHLQALQKIADANGGNRAAGTRGYDASVEYVLGTLRGAGFDAGTSTYEPRGGHGNRNDDDDEAPEVGTNVIAETRTGDAGSVIMIGAHLDSVPEGPGIVDDGSGVAALLEIAARLGNSPDIRNKVRFAFFGHEEAGARGSRGYVDGLPGDEVKKIKMYLNVDMIASPNGGYIVQGGKGGDEEETGPPGSATIAQVLVNQLIATGVSNPEITEFVGDDETAFIEAGIPVGGAENGDAKKKTAQQAAAWGGQAGEVYDPCYHQACDNITNVNQEVLNHYLPALAGTLHHFATTTDALR